MESAFGESFGDVGVFFGEGDFLSSIGATAAAMGQDIFLPENPSKEDVAHELTHIVQNRSTGASPGMQKRSVSTPNDAAEQQAELVAQEVVKGKTEAAKSVSANPAQPSSAVMRRTPAAPPKIIEKSAKDGTKYKKVGTNYYRVDGAGGLRRVTSDDAEYQSVLQLFGDATGLQGQMTLAYSQGRSATSQGGFSDQRSQMKRDLGQNSNMSKLTDTQKNWKKNNVQSSAQKYDNNDKVHSNGGTQSTSSTNTSTNSSANNQDKSKFSKLKEKLKKKELSVNKSLKPTVEFQLPMGLVGSLRGTFELTANLSALPKWDVSLNSTDGLKGEAFVGATASASIAGGVGLGAGLAGIANAGVAGDLKLAANGKAGVDLAGQVYTKGNSLEAKASGDVGLSLDLTGSVNLTPYISLKCINKRYDYPITLASFKFLEWAPKLAGVEYDTAKTGLQYKNLDNTSDVKVNLPQSMRGGMVDGLLNWINEDNTAAAAIEELKASGLLARMNPEEKSKLISKVMDSYVTGSHETAILDALASERSISRRWWIAVRAYEIEHRCIGRGTRKKAFDWLDGGIDNKLFGPKNYDRLRALLPQ